jgi:ribosomal protein S18 acetylase RimI-like enzyme
MTLPSVKTKNVQSRDEIYEIAVFLEACWKAEYCGIIADDFLGTMSVDVRYKGLLDRFNEKTSDFLALREGEKLVGAAVFGKSFTEGYPDDGEISAIYLHHDYIGKGYGRALMVKIEELLMSKGYANFVLDVLSDNTRAVQFYLAHGYEIVKESAIKLGERDYPLKVMRKRGAESEH